MDRRAKKSPPCCRFSLVNESHTIFQTSPLLRNALHISILILIWWESKSLLNYTGWEPWFFHDHCRNQLASLILILFSPSILKMSMEWFCCTFRNEIHRHGFSHSNFIHKDENSRKVISKESDIYSVFTEKPKRVFSFTHTDWALHLTQKRWKRLLLSALALNFRLKTCPDNMASFKDEPAVLIRGFILFIVWNLFDRFCLLCSIQLSKCLLSPFELVLHSCFPPLFCLIRWGISCAEYIYIYIIYIVLLYIWMHMYVSVYTYVGI